MRRSGVVACVLLFCAAARAGESDRPAPRAYASLVPRVGYPEPFVFSNLVYEANNAANRGARDASGLIPEEVDACANLRAIGARVRGLFVLRDALFSQPDHPIDQRPSAPMLPPSWVTIAVAETLRGARIEPVLAPPPEDDAAWAALPSARATFGSFVASDRLFAAAREATLGDGPEARRARHARAVVIAFAEDVRAMIAAAPRGPAAVAEAGAARIVASDRRCFGVERAHLWPISVEHPNDHERDDEGKGFVPAFVEVPPEAVTLARDAVLRARLAEGPLALERYDVHLASERARLLEVLAAVVPSGSTGPALWVWVNGGLDARGIDGTPPDAAFPRLRRELTRDRRVARARVRFFAKPHVTLAPDATREALDAVLRRRPPELTTSLNVDSRRLRRILAGAR